jgi:hypothetical protein
VTSPFPFEGVRRRQVADEGLAHLAEHAHLHSTRSTPMSWGPQPPKPHGAL